MSVLAALCAGLAVWVLLQDGSRDRLQRLSESGVGPVGAGTDPDGGLDGSPRRAWLTSPVLVGSLVGLAVLMVVGGVLGAVAGPLSGIAVGVAVRRLEPAAERRRRERIEADLPLVLDLLVAVTAAGRPPTQALEVVADTVGGPVAVPLRLAVARLALGADPATVWRELGSGPGLTTLARALARSGESGSALVRTLERCADDLRDQARATALEQARAVGVKTAAPLGGCFLPAFVILGIVPVVVATFGVMHL